MADELNFMTGAMPRQQGGIFGAYMRAGQQAAESKVPFGDLMRATKGMELQAAQYQMQASAYNMQTVINQKKGMAELSGLIAQEGFDFSNPDHYDQFLSVAGRYGVDSKAIEPQLKRFETSMEFSRRRDAIRAAREHVGEGAVVARAGVGASGSEFIEFENPASASRGLSFEERMMLIKEEQGALNDRERMRHSARVEMAQKAREWDQLKYMDQRLVKLYQSEIDQAIASTFSERVLAEKIDAIRESYAIDPRRVEGVSPGGAAPQQQGGSLPPADESDPMGLFR